MTMTKAAATGTSIRRITIGSTIVLVILAVLPRLVDPYQTVLLTYGLIMAIAALGFNLLLGYTGLLSFGHSAYFGAGAYLVAFIMRDFGVHSMELCIVGGMLGTLIIAAIFGFVCVRHTRIFFGILTLLLGDGRNRRHSGTLWQSLIGRRPGRLQGSGLVPAFHLCLLLLCARDVRSLHAYYVGDRALTLRQGATSDP
jgi:ABC-type branched-subunit amino acid transport system permease subunit